ncbi:MAG: Eco57I restriction-modification methylase domain-containing protein [Bacteroidales bacterium]|jgi:type II restriction/modification system DNA methylase subunit YeeA|nr:Eco57I restriction-modification methylase domain-containing protein [Bacteroidales bacterium]
MAELTIAKSLNKAYRQVPVERPVFNIFKAQLSNYYKQISSIDTEEKLKGDLMDFLKFTFYSQNYKVSPNGDIDCAIHLGVNVTDPVGVIIEVKKPTNATEMITKEDLNRKAPQELLLYYLRERHIKKNIQLKQLIVTNVYEYFVFDAHEFEGIFYSNKKLIKRFEEFNAGALTSEKTDFFYKEIAADFIANVLDQITYTWFDIRKYKQFLDTGNDKRIIELFKFFSPEHLLKKRFQNDSNSLNTKFYSELLYIIGLEEVVEKDSKKHIITRRKEVERNQASLLENAITILDSEDWLDNVKDRYSFGKNRQEQLFGVALALTIGWANRILFIKLLEAQLVKYHKGDQSYAFMRPSVIPDYDELNKLFFQVLAKRITDRSERINTKYGKVPYLNSSLFEISPLERQTIRISSLDNSELPLFNGTVLKDGQKPRYDKLPTLRYLLEFLDAYDFSSEGSEEVQEQAKTLINASVLGLIFEKINGHRDGSVFTPGAVTMYMSREAIQQTVVRRFNEEMGWSCKDYEALKNKDIEDYVQANAVIDSLRICDPAVGSGHFLVSVLNEVIYTKYDLGILIDGSGKRIKKQDYSIDIENDELLISDEDGNPVSYIPGNQESQRIQETLFNEKRKIIENCLFGVDINPNAVNICRLRLWIELLKNAYYTKESDYTELETLPNIDINIKVGNSLLHRFNLGQDISEILRKSGISISAYRKAVSDYKNAHSKEEKHDLEDYLRQIKGNLRTQIGLKDPKVVSLNKLNADLDNLLAPQLFEISKKERAQRDKQAKDLQAKIAKIQAEVDEIKDNKIFVGAFEWRIEFPEVLDEDGRFVGFDCVIGNPPYIQLQKMGTDADTLQKMNYETYERTGDIYCLFYEMGMKLLKPGALLSFITSNKWMRANYGKSLREHLSSKYNPTLLIDFANNKIFDSATVLVNILSLEKCGNQGHTISCSVEDGFDVSKLSDYVQTHIQVSSFKTDDTWSILSEIELSIKRKVEDAGVPLKNWNVEMYRGILTGYNDAFIITSEKREEILSNCADDSERERTAEIIRPILRGRDIRRYGYEWADLWLINTHNGVKDSLERVHIEDYPAIKQHLDYYWDKIESRADKGDTPYNLRNCAYVDEFSKPKIVWGNLNTRGSYAMAPENMFINAPACMIVPGSQYLLTMLNSKVADYYIRNLGVVRNGGFFEYKPMFVEQIPVPLPREEVVASIEDVFNSDIPDELKDKRLEEIIESMFDFTEPEIAYLRNQ